MTETMQSYLDLDVEGESRRTSSGFQSALAYIREKAQSEHHKGKLFERLMQKYFSVDPVYKDRFSEVWLWSEWAEHRTDFDAVDIGIDLVAEEREGGYCAIQCKCYAPETRITKGHLDSFLGAASPEPFTSKIVVDTGGEWGENARRIIEPHGETCTVLRSSDLENSPINWPDLSLQAPEELDSREIVFNLRDYQQEAFDDAIEGFSDADRGKLIMACGTGKTFTALRIAEEIAGVGGRVLYLVPSIGLFSQTMREWAEQKVIPHRYVGICSDTQAGKVDEDASILELEIPVTTKLSNISKALNATKQDVMTVVFCTYHSLPLVEEVQEIGAPAFDIIICDEAHRTTGIERQDGSTSHFNLVHDENRIRANKRLYMTATSRLYTEGAKAKALRYDRAVFSMDDEETYGPEFHRLPFSKAVDSGILSDYKVVVLTISGQDADPALQRYISMGGGEIPIDDATKIIGCWRALQNPESKQSDEGEIQPLTRAIAFTNRIKDSKALEYHWDNIIENAIQQMPEDSHPREFKCQVQHVDGTTNALNRKRRIEWLKGNDEGVCRILSNARCLSEGIDVPALDAVLFMDSRKSHVDIVQAVGRVMRKAEGKDYGYIVLPIAIRKYEDPAYVLNNTDRFSVMWDVLRALRSHDDRLDAEINKIDLNTKKPERIIFTGIDGADPSNTLNGEQLYLDLGISPSDIYTTIVDKCGDRRYWENWAKDVADIFNRLVERIENLLENPENDALRERFDDFHLELKRTINTSITQNNAIDMMAQHILTKPVFDALFENYDFSARNPMASALDNLQNDFAEFGLEIETRDLEGFYESVRMRAQGIDNSEGRQKVLSELYENFFVTALRKEADRLGIVYTPVEVVDFILHSANEILQDEFGRSLSDDGVHVLDPFTGTGTFIARLLQSDLIRPDDLERKYREELHANELVLLAYYIAAVNIEEVFRGKRGEGSGYEPFNGIVLTDTFNLNKAEDPTLFPREWLPENNERAEKQQKLPIQVIVGNPPWSAGQRNEIDGNPNVEYPELEARVSETYAEHSKTTLKRHLFDTYKMAIRWASDRIGKQGIIAFVTNGSWIDGNVEAGIRACLAEEFSSIHVLHLRGNARTSGERRRAEGGNAFGGGSRAPVAVMILVKNPNAIHEGCKIQYRDIGDYLTREEKLEALTEAISIKGFSDWQAITPDKHSDWVDQRSDAFTEFYPLGTKEAKAGKTDDAIFKLYSLGWVTNRDAYVYNFSRDTLLKNARLMTEDYLTALSEFETTLKANPELLSNKNALKVVVGKITQRHNSNSKWNRELMNNLKGKKKTEFDDNYIRKVLYRPFVATNCYADYTFIHCKYQMDRIFPDASSENRVICVSGIGSSKPFSVLMTNMMSDLQLLFNGQCFPRYQYPEPSDTQNATGTFDGINNLPDRIDNISDTALQAFRDHYRDNTITKDDVFDYVYGVLHVPSYMEDFANDLSKMIPRIPFAPDFLAFAEAGRLLADLHLNYEICDQYPDLKVEPVSPSLLWEPEPEHFLLGTRAMRFADREAKTTLTINEHVCLSGIPEEAHRYVVNGRTPLEWFIDRYKIKQDRNSGIINDPNGWFENPRDLITAIERIVYVSVESTKIIESLPSEVTSS